MMTTLKGSPQRIGLEYGREFVEGILGNLRILVWREGYEPLPLHDVDFLHWVAQQEELIATSWPWLLEEMQGTAKGAGVSHKDIFLLNLRSWQYGYYGAKPAQSACSSLVITLSDGTIANAGALDDTAELYHGPVRIIPDSGYQFITFPITGTSWATRGLNSAGLAVGISSQLLPGLLGLPNTINQDLATRVIMQTCATVEEVREFCLKHPFTQNLACSDAEGGVFCAHQTSAQLFDLAIEAPFALTNHMVADELVNELSAHGVTEFPYALTTRERRGNLLSFVRQYEARTNAEEVRGFIARKDTSSPGSISHDGTIVQTYANPQAEPGVFWIAQPGIAGAEEWMEYQV